MNSTCKNKHKVPQEKTEQNCSNARKWTTQKSAQGLYFSIIKRGASSDAGSGIPQRARRAGCLSSKLASGAESTISLQSFHSQQLKVIIHSQGWRNTSGAAPIFKHISQLNDLWGGVKEPDSWHTAICQSECEGEVTQKKNRSCVKVVQCQPLSNGDSRNVQEVSMEFPLCGCTEQTHFRSLNSRNVCSSKLTTCILALLLVHVCLPSKL